MKLFLKMTMTAALIMPLVALSKDVGQITKKAQNPISDMVSMPVQAIYSLKPKIQVKDGGTDFAETFETQTDHVYRLQPVIPFSFGKINMINRIIIDTKYTNIFTVTETASKYERTNSWEPADLIYSFYISPQSNGPLTWGIGADLSWMGGMGEDNALLEKIDGKDEDGIADADRTFMAGATGAVFFIKGAITGGLLATWKKTWNDAKDGNDMFTLIQPMINYNIGTSGMYVNYTPEITFKVTQLINTAAIAAGLFGTSTVLKDSHLEASTWEIPLGLGFGKVMHTGSSAINLNLSYYYTLSMSTYKDYKTSTWDTGETELKLDTKYEELDANYHLIKLGLQFIIPK